MLATTPKVLVASGLLAYMPPGMVTGRSRDTGEDLVHARAGDRHQLGAAGGGRILDVAAGWPTTKAKPSILLSHRAAPCSSGLSPEASQQKSEAHIPIAGRRTSSSRAGPNPVADVEALALKSSILPMLASLRASTVSGSPCEENTERSWRRRRP